MARRRKPDSVPNSLELLASDLLLLVLGRKAGVGAPELLGVREASKELLVYFLDLSPVVMCGHVTLVRGRYGVMTQTTNRPVVLVLGDQTKGFNQDQRLVSVPIAGSHALPAEREHRRIALGHVGFVVTRGYVCD